MHSRLRILASLPLQSLAALPLSSSQQVSGKVVSITEGDTIEVLIDGKAEKVRLDGIDAREKSKAYRTKAKQSTSVAAFGKTVTVYRKDKDRYRRLAGEVILPHNGNMNQPLVGGGLPRWYRQYAPKDKALLRLQGEVSVARQGLWRDIEQIPRWEFRQGKTTLGGASEGRHL